MKLTGFLIEDRLRKNEGEIEDRLWMDGRRLEDRDRVGVRADGYGTSVLTADKAIVTFLMLIETPDC